MTEIKLGYVTDRNTDETAVKVDFDYAGHGMDDYCVIITVKDDCYPNLSSWMNPKDARQLAQMLIDAAAIAESENEKVLKEEAEYRGYRVD